MLDLQECPYEFINEILSELVNQIQTNMQTLVLTNINTGKMDKPIKPPTKKSVAHVFLILLK